MRVMTFNICGHRARKKPEHIDEVAAVIRELRPDVVGLQEVYEGDEGGWSGNQPRRLEELTGLTCCHWPHLWLRGGNYGNAVMTRGKIVHAEMYRLPGRLLEQRALLETRIELDGTSVHFFSTHLVHFGPLMSRSRRRQVAQIMRHMAGNRPRVLVGDLNTGWHGLDVEALAAIGLEPVYHEEVPTYPAHRPRLTLDHIFTSRAWRCKGVRAFPSQASDHLPLYADLEPTGQESGRATVHSQAPGDPAQALPGARG